MATRGTQNCAATRGTQLLWGRMCVLLLLSPQVIAADAPTFKRGFLNRPPLVGAAAAATGWLDAPALRCSEWEQGGGGPAAGCGGCRERRNR
jgi:hypothetical protein